MAYRNKVYIAFDADSDISYYRLMTAWKQNDKTDFNFSNAHDLNNLMSTSSEETIKAKLRVRMANTKIFILLIGKSTKNLHKFVRWEIELALKLGLPIIAVNLDNDRKKDSDTCPAILRDELAIFVPFKQKVIAYALEHWEGRHYELVGKGESGSRYYTDKVYSDLGL